jgi:ribosomal protein L11 methyltransferase
MNYYELTVQLADFSGWNDIMVAYLADLDYESFQVEQPNVKAYIQEELFDGEKLQLLLDNINEEQEIISSFEVKFIPQQNWNAQWEAQFEPVFIGEDIRVVAPFHQLETTHLMCASMLGLDLQSKRVLDMGSGTGVLAILAEKLGATDIVAIDIEAWSAENCADNAVRNHCQYIHSVHGGVEQIPSDAFDVILANINKNVLKSQLSTYKERMKSGAYLLLSGFFVSDTEELKLLASDLKLTFHAQYEREGWAVLIFKK